jgi:predicted transcriptional regulator
MQINLLELLLHDLACVDLKKANQMVEESKSNDILSMTTEIVAAHVGHNNVAQGELTELIRIVYSALSELSGGAAPARPTPAVPVRRSVAPDYIVCLEDGKKLKMLKRHLQTAYKMTPEEYRERWGLPADYPMVAPNYGRVAGRAATRPIFD